VPAHARAALLAAVLAVVSGCTGGDGDGDPAPDTAFHRVLGTVDLDAATGSDARMSALAPRPGGGAVALLDTAAGGVLVEVLLTDGVPRAGAVTPVPTSAAGAELVVSPGGLPYVVSAGAAGSTLELVAGPAVTALGPAPDVVAAALSPDGGTLVIATGDRRLTAVDPVTGVSTATGDLPAGATVTRLAAGPDGAVVALLAIDDDTVLQRFDADLRRDGGPVELVPKEVTRPADVEVGSDGTVVVTVTTADSGRLLVVEGDEVARTVDLGRTADSSLDLALSRDGRHATVPLAALQEEARVATFDLANGDLVGETVLCDGFGSLGATALSADADVLVVTGVCLADGVSRAFLLG
jgi:hypothetical protein